MYPSSVPDPLRLNRLIIKDRLTAKDAYIEFVPYQANTNLNALWRNTTPQFKTQPVNALDMMFAHRDVAVKVSHKIAGSPHATLGRIGDAGYNGTVIPFDTINNGTTMFGVDDFVVNIAANTITVTQPGAYMITVNVYFTSTVNPPIRIYIWPEWYNTNTGIWTAEDNFTTIHEVQTFDQELSLNTRRILNPSQLPRMYRFKCAMDAATLPGTTTISAPPQPVIDNGQTLSSRAISISFTLDGLVLENLNQWTDVYGV